MRVRRRSGWKKREKEGKSAASHGGRDETVVLVVVAFTVDVRRMEAPAAGVAEQAMLAVQHWALP